ncbi:hypothetical protein BG011_006169 [Mortierella polycephala]|uniref:Transmembrane protein n=1 Tax=Mortierella polycephala TaxID=41804 RepID=A0A9P6QB84_9FUNG|nr:hypothetical protein BG011_006169 [Mortierella polycephala]
MCPHPPPSSQAHACVNIDTTVDPSTTPSYTSKMDPTTSTFIQEQQQHQDGDIETQILKTLASHLDLLTAGSLFLLPSILSFLASALTAYTASPPPSFSQSFSTLNETGHNKSILDDWSWQTTWILLLPCIGVMIPLLLFKVLSSLEERSFECPFKCWWNRRMNDNNCLRRRVSKTKPAAVVPVRSWILTCPTINTIKRTWRVLKGDPPGYGPLALDTSSLTTTAAPSSLSFSRTRTASTSNPTWSVFISSDKDLEEDEGDEGLCTPPQPCTCTCNCGESGDTSKENEHYMIGKRRSVLPRPKIILLSSLCAWTVLMGLSSSLGFNTIEPSSTVHTTVSEYQLSQSSWERQGGFFKPEDVEGKDNSQFQDAGPIVNPDIDPQDTLMKNVWLAEEDEIWDQEQTVEPFATIRTNLVILKKRDQAPVSEGNEPDQVDLDYSEDEDMLDALIMDAEDETMFRDFLRRIDTEEQTQQQKQEQILKATDDLVVTPMIENDLPCSHRVQHSQLIKWLANLPTTIFGGDEVNDLQEMEQTEYSQIFAYRGWCTDAMIVALTMCLGGVLVGLAQSKVLYEQLLEQQDPALMHAMRSRRRIAFTSVISCLFLSGSALGLTVLMILADCWDVPSVYFIGIGIAGMILVHAWVPDAALLVELSADQEEVHEHYDDEKSTLEHIWSPPATERRNACSLDMSQRWELTACCYQASCFSR